MMDYMMDYSDISDTKVIKSPLYCTPKKKKKNTHTHTPKGRCIRCLLINSINSKIMSSLSPKVQLTLLSPYRHQRVFRQQR